MNIDDNDDGNETKPHLRNEKDEFEKKQTITLMMMRTNGKRVVVVVGPHGFIFVAR